jgi:hypothetical protein
MKKFMLAGLAAGAAMLLVQLSLNFVFYAMFPDLPKEYQNASLFRPWSDPLMQLYYLSPFLVGLFFAWLWHSLHSYFVEHRFAATKLGVIYFLGSVPGQFMIYSSFRITAQMFVTWLSANLVSALVGCWIVAALVERKTKTIKESKKAA